MDFVIAQRKWQAKNGQKKTQNFVSQKTQIGGQKAGFFNYDGDPRSSLLSPVFENQASKLDRSFRLFEAHSRSQIRFDNKVISLTNKLHPDPFNSFRNQQNQTQTHRYTDYATEQCAETSDNKVNLFVSQEKEKKVLHERHRAGNNIFNSQIVERINDLTRQPQSIITTPNARKQPQSLLNYIGLDKVPINQYNFQLQNMGYKGFLEKSNKKIYPPGRKLKRQNDLFQRPISTQKRTASRNGDRQSYLAKDKINVVNEYDFQQFNHVHRSNSQIKIRDEPSPFIMPQQAFFSHQQSPAIKNSNKNDKSLKRFKLYTNLKVNNEPQLVFPQLSPKLKCLSQAESQSSQQKLVRMSSKDSANSLLIETMLKNKGLRLESEPDHSTTPKLHTSMNQDSSAPNTTKSKSIKIQRKADLVGTPTPQEILQKKHDFQEHLQKFPPPKIEKKQDRFEKEQLLKAQQRREMIKKYNKISANQNKISGTLKFEIQKGNNSEALRRVMQNRLLLPTANAAQEEAPNPEEESTLWEEVQNSHLINFRWKPTSYGINFERLSKFGNKQLVNHLQGHESLTTKDQLFFNMKQYYENHKKNVFQVLPLTLPVDFSDRGNAEEQWDLIVKIVQLFDKNLGLSAADLNTQIAKLQKSKDKAIKTSYQISDYEHQHKNLWLLKPTGLNRGIGIHVFNSIADLKSILWTHYRIQNFQPAANTPVQVLDEQKELSIQNKTFIVQKYIEQPILFRDRKFDVRQWVLISHDGQCYMFEHAYVRTSSEIYNLDETNLDQVYVHLTNNAVQKYSKSYGKFEEANIVAVETLIEELAQFTPGYKADELGQKLKKQMKNIIVESLQAVKQHLKFNKHSFELVGYDFMMVPGQPLDVRLIEANTNPCLEEPNALLKMLIPRMLDDMLKIVLDPLFNGSFNGTNFVYPVTGHNDTQNLWEFILQLQI